MEWKTMRRWGPLVAWLILIFVGSSIPRLSVGKLGQLEGADKVAHFTEYLILAVLFYRGWRGQGVRWLLPPWMVVAAVGFAIGALDELHQTFIPGRECSIWDWSADALGIVLGTLIAVLLARRADRGVREA